MSEAEREDLLARSLEEYLLRRARGESPHPEDWSDALGEAFDEFREVVETENRLERLLEPPPGEVLPRKFGPYTLLREIGRGAAGVVYEALHEDLGRREAVKVLRAGFDADRTALERFRREAKALASVRHPNVVEVYDAGCVEGRSYYAMELLHGPALSALYRRGRLPAYPDLMRGLAEVADALQALHGAGIVHRDVKPSNIVVEPDGRMVLADFGLARAAESISMTASGQALGTPLYMSPEQMLGRRRDIDGRSDVYGLGATLYEVLAGRPVFKTDDVRELLRKVLSERPTPLRRVAPGIPAACEAVAMKALEKRPEDRYQAAAAMADDLRALAAGEPVLGRPVTPLRRGLRWARARAVPIAALLLVGVGLALWYATRPATLRVEANVAGALVRLDGEVLGEVPVDLSLEPGTYRIAVEREGFAAAERQWDVERGSNGLWFCTLVAAAPYEPEAIGLLGSAVGETVGAFDGPERMRGGLDRDEGCFRPLFPSGRVRLADLTETVVETGEEAPAVGRLVFLRDGELLSEAPFVPVEEITHTPLPEALLARLSPGDVVSWGCEREDGKVQLTEFEVVGDSGDLTQEIARREEVLAEQDPTVKSYFRGLLYLREGLYMAAYHEGERAAEKGEESLLTLGVMQEALQALGHKETAAWGQVRSRILFGPYSEEQREAWFQPKAPR